MKKILGWVAVAVFGIAISVAYATVIKDDMTFTGAVTFSGTETHSGAITNSSTVTNSGVVTNSDGVYFNDEVVFEPYKSTNSGSSTALTWAYSNGNILVMSGASQHAVTLPIITAVMSGYVLITKNESGATTRKLFPGTGDRMESPQGTLSGTSDANVKDNGDVLVWKAIHSSHSTGSTSVWMILSYDY